MLDLVTQRILVGFQGRTLSKVEWTHEAHLRVCWAALTTRTPDETSGFLRNEIRSYNVATGVANTTTAGYYETLTVYFVRSVAQLQASSIDQVLHSPRVTATAPFAHWTRGLLFSESARARWADPDLAPLPPTSELRNDER